MTKEEEALLLRLQTRVRQLLLQDQRLQQRNATLTQAVAQRDAKIALLEQEQRDLSSQYANLKIAKVMELSGNDARSAHRRLTNLVRQVDECLALLKS